jgi:hypothetical protein
MDFQVYVCGADPSLTAADALLLGVGHPWCFSTARKRRISGEHKGGVMRRSNRVQIISLATLMILWLPKSNLAQTVNGTFRGTVTDSSGAVVPGATVTVTNTATGVSRTAIADAGGSYVLTELPPGVYDFKVISTGFATLESRGVTLLVNQTGTVDFALKPGSVRQEIEVTGQAPLANYTNATVGTVIDSQEVVQLPLNGRQFSQLILLAPGAADQGTVHQPIFDFRSELGAVSPAVNGAHAEFNNFTIDGVENNEWFFNFMGVSPPPDAIQEFKVQSDMSSGEYGKGAGANVNVVTKSGTNEWHGDAWEFDRNTHLNARNFFNPSVSGYHQNQFGGTLGGPIRKEKVWAFGWYEGFRKSQGSSILSQVPTADQLNGDLSAFAPIFNPFSTVQTGTDAQGNPIFTRAAFSGNQIPTSLLNPTAEAIAHLLYPQPNYAGQNGVNYLNLTPETATENQFGVRVDAALTQNTTFFSRFAWDYGYRNVPGNGGNLPEGTAFQNGLDVQPVLGLTHIFGPKTVLDLHAQFLRVSAVESTKVWPASFLNSNGITNPGDWPLEGGFPPLMPNINITDVDSLVGSKFTESGYPMNTWEFNGSLSKMVGNHALHMGAGDVHTWVLDNCTYATGSFTPVPTSDPQNPATTGSGLASFLLGVPSGGQRLVGLEKMTYASGDYSAYFDDVWKVTPKLTATLGLRYDYDAPFRDTHGRAATLDIYDSTPNRTVWDIQYGAPATQVNLALSPITIQHVHSIFLPQKKNFEPRIGLAYRLGHDMSIRSGYGIFYDYGQAVINSQEIMGQWPFGFPDFTPGDLNLPAPGNPTPTNILGVNVFPAFAPTLAPSAGMGYGISRRDPFPYMQQWNLAVEKKLGDWLFSGTYVGSKGTDICLYTALNIAPPGPAPDNVPNNAPLPQFDPFESDVDQGNSSYQALELKVERRFLHGFELLASYTFSKSIDESSEHFGGGGLPSSVNPNSADYKAYRGVSDFDMPQNFVANYVYSLPFGRGQRYLHGPGLVTHLVSGWQTTGILTLHSGFPFSIVAPYDVANSGAFSEFPWLVAPLFPSGFHRTLQEWFNTQAVGLIPYTYGNLGRNVLRAGNVGNFDFGLFKRTPITERINTEFRFESFNLTNHPNFLPPNVGMTSPSFGEVLSASNPRFIQFGFKVLF